VTVPMPFADVPDPRGGIRWVLPDTSKHRSWRAPLTLSPIALVMVARNVRSSFILVLEGNPFQVPNGGRRAVAAGFGRGADSAAPSRDGGNGVPPSIIGRAT